MNHASPTPDSDGVTELVVASPSSVANPRRIRLGADGRPISVTAPVSESTAA